MALKIIKSTDVIIINQVKALVYAPPGVGKTSLGFTAEKPLCLDFDKGAHRSENRQDSVDISSWEDVARLTPDDLAPYNTIIVDTLGRCLDFLSAFLIDNDRKLARKDGALTMQGYGALKSSFAQWINRLTTLNKDIILIAHRKRDKDRDDTFFVPDIVGGSYDEVIKIVDFMGYMYKENGKTILNFNPSDSWDGKNSAGFPPLVIPNFIEQPMYFAGKIAEMKSKMGQVSQKAKEAVETVRTWTDTIATYNTPDDFTRGLKEIQKLDKPLQIQIGAVLKTRRENLKIGVDAEKNFFWLPAEPAEPTPQPAAQPVQPEPKQEPAAPVQPVQAPLTAEQMKALSEMKNEATTQAEPVVVAPVTQAAANSPAFPF